MRGNYELFHENSYDDEYFVIKKFQIFYVFCFKLSYMKIILYYYISNEK
jgi:hypothetical protein